MAKAVKTSVVKRVQLSGIEIRTDAMPELVRKAKAAGRYDDVLSAIEVMTPGSWFIVPETEELDQKAVRGVLMAIGRFKKDRNIAGVFAALAADGSGLVVRKVGDGIEE